MTLLVQILEGFKSSTPTSSRPRKENVSKFSSATNRGIKRELSTPKIGSSSNVKRSTSNLQDDAEEEDIDIVVLSDADTCELPRKDEIEPELLREKGEISRSQYKSAKSLQNEMIERIAERLVSFPKAERDDYRFCSLGELQITIPQYVERLVQITNQWTEEEDSPDSAGIRCALMAIEYLERIQVKISSMTIHRYFAIAFLLGLKFTEDFVISNTFWSKVGGFNLLEANEMELAFFQKLNWNIHITTEAFQSQRRKFEIDVSVDSIIDCFDQY